LVPKLSAQGTKNLFLRDKSGKRHILLILHNKKNVNLKQFAQENGYKNLSLASSERLQNYLGVEPGAVSILGLINDKKREVEVFIDEDVWGAKAITAHPLRNDMTLVISMDDIKKILKILNYQVHIIKLNIK
jgi:Ala-tRNA(Pro) deacylase